jgi:phosphatidylcholine synthase
VDSTDHRPSGARRAGAAAVHALTASGALWGVLALRAVCAGQPRAALGWLGLALVVDALDGPLARGMRAAESLPQIDGALLDNVIDYLTYVVVPSMLVATFLPAALGWAGAGAICTTAALQFVHRRAKTDESFRGFPSYWNVVAAYFVLLEPGPRTAAFVTAALSLLAFAPIAFVYPTRTRLLRRTTLAASALWLAVLALAVARHPHASRALATASLAFPAYYLGVSLVLTAQGRDR